MYKVIFLGLTLFCSISIQAQTSVKTQQFKIKPGAKLTAKEVKRDFESNLIHLEKPVPGGIPQEKITYQKKSKQFRSPLTPQNESLPDMGLGMNFFGNSFNNGTPCDNDMAISNGNKLVSVINSIMAFYDVSGSTPVTLGTLSLAAFADTLGLPHDEFDPKVIYDPSEDKFIAVCLNGYTDTTSSIIVGFSQTNDPTGEWNVYSIPGNPLNNGLWTDYPIISLTNNELFITVNLLYPDSSWQTGFNESIIWQINKFKGYAYDTLDANLINGIQFNGRPIRNLCPVKGGSQLYGPDMYFLSNRNFEVQGDTIFLIHVTDTASAPGFNVTVQQLNSNADYFLAGDARQTGTHRLATNDSRILGAFLEDDVIQFVGNSMDTSTTYCGIYHGKITTVSSTPVVVGQIISDTLRDIGYPNISYAGNGPGDQTAIISFDHTAPTVNPGVSAIKTDGNFNYSYIKRIKDGSSYVNLLGSAQERWGDYSGSQRKYNAIGEVWCAGYLGYQAGLYRAHRAYISQLVLNSLVEVNEGNLVQEPVSKIYPNPASETVNIEFSIDKIEYLYFNLTDVNGKLIKQLMREKVKAGKNAFSFNISDMPKGIYYLSISNGHNINLTSKIVKD